MWPRVMSVLKQMSMTRGGDFVVLVPNVCGSFVFGPCFVMQSSTAITLLRKRELVASLKFCYCDRWMSTVRRQACVVRRHHLLQRTSPRIFDQTWQD